MRQWEKPRQLIGKSLNKKSTQDFSVQETAEFLLASEAQLRQEGFTRFTWNYDSGYYDDGCQRTKTQTLVVTGSRLATDAEQAQYEADCRAKTIANTRFQIESFKREQMSNEQKIVDLNKNLTRFTAKLSQNPNRQNDIKNVTKAISRRETWIAELQEKRQIFEPLLALPEDIMVSEYYRLDKEQYEKKYGVKETY